MTQKKSPGWSQLRGMVSGSSLGQTDQIQTLLLLLSVWPWKSHLSSLGLGVCIFNGGLPLWFPPYLMSWGLQTLYCLSSCKLSVINIKHFPSSPHILPNPDWKYAQLTLLAGPQKCLQPLLCKGETQWKRVVVFRNYNGSYKSLASWPICLCTWGPNI